MKKRFNKTVTPPDYLTPLLERAPATWALIRANEIRHLENVRFNPPVLDVGCGDGLVAKMILKERNQKFDWGIDLSHGEIEFAKKSGSFKKCRTANVYNLPFKNNSFTTVFSNSVIEHIPDLNQALSEMSRVLKKDGQFIITVPTPYLTSYLIGVTFLSKLKLNFLATLYGKFFNKMFAHYNLLNHKEWQILLSKYDLKLTNHAYYHTPKMIRAHEVLAYLAIPYGILKLVLGYWPVFPRFRRIFIVPWLRKILYPYYLDNTTKQQGGSLLIVAKKITK